MNFRSKLLILTFFRFSSHWFAGIWRTPMISLAYASLSSSPSNLSSLKLRLPRPPSTFSTSLSNLKSLNPCDKAASDQVKFFYALCYSFSDCLIGRWMRELTPLWSQKRIGNGVCRADLGNDGPFAVAIGACILSSFVFPVAGGGSDDESDAVIDSTDTRFAVMGIISFIPYFNWLVCMFQTFRFNLLLFRCYFIFFFRLIG